jgi:uncharacterized membrane-anchored protein
MTPAAFVYCLVAACVFVPIFVIALAMLKSARRAFVIAAIFAMGSVFGFFVAGSTADMALGHAVGSDFRNALGVAFATGGAVAGGVLAVWAFARKTGLRL